jgi:hypothetical protein
VEEENKIEEEGTEMGMKGWVRDNLRIIISVVIVIAIAGGIYSYSKRTQAPTITEPGEEQAMEKVEQGGEEVAEQPKEEAKPGEKAPAEKEQVTSAATSRETEGSFIETAARGNGVTHLARTALANYLEKNPDSTLAAEHKIYIEDYLRKKVGFKGGVHVGTSVEFSKDLINQAITQSKTLNEAQLKNLHKYAVKVPSLS